MYCQSYRQAQWQAARSDIAAASLGSIGSFREAAITTVRRFALMLVYSFGQASRLLSKARICSVAGCPTQATGPPTYGYIGLSVRKALQGQMPVLDSKD